MSEKNWDRVPIDAQSIDAPLSRAAIFLVVTVASEETALAKVCSVLDGLDDLIKTVGFRDLSARLSCIVGIGCDLWNRLHFGKRPQELKPFARIEERPMRRRRRRAICFSISDPNARTCALNSNASCSTASAPA